MTFEWYEPKADMLMVSISPRSITFYNQTVQAMNDPEYIVLGFNEEEKVIAVKACRQLEEKSIAFISKRHSSYVRINDRNFIRLIETKIGKNLSIKGSPVKYMAEWDECEEILYIYLNQSENVNT